MELTIEQVLRHGVAAHKDGKLSDAERLYRAILQSQPEHPDANHNLGVIAVSVNKVDEALPLFKAALEANPKIQQFWLSYIDALIKKQQFENAKKVLVQAKTQGVAEEKLNVLGEYLERIAESSTSIFSEKKKSLTFSEKRKNLTERKKKEKKKKQNMNGISPSQEQLTSLLDHYQNGRLNEAETLSLEITQGFPKHQFAWKVLGAILGATGRKSEAVDANQTAVALSPQDAEAHSNLGNRLQELGRLDEAEACYNQAIELKPDFAEAHSNLGNTLQALGRLDEAKACYNQAIALKSDYAEVHGNLGNTLREMGRLNGAEASCKKAIVLKPDFAEAHSNLGVTLQELGRLDESEVSCNTAIELKPDFAEAYYNLSNTFREMGRLDDAEASCKKAIVLKLDYAEAHNNLGITLQELRRLDEAEACYYKTIALKPDYAEAHSNLGVTLQELGRLEESEAYHNQAIVMKLEYPEAHYNLGITLQELGRLREAEASYNRAIVLKPDYAEAHNNLGITLQELGRLDEAEACYNQAIAFKPDHAEANLNLCELLEKMNRVDEILSFFRSKSRKIFEKKSDFLYYEALIEFREENYERAAELIEKINLNELLDTRQPAAMKLKGDIYHQKKRYSAAFEAYKAKNKYVKDSLEYKKQEPEKYFIEQRKKVVQIEQLQKQSAYKSVIKPTWIQPVFLIGFPRSGTTLLDTILRTHSNIDVLEELPMLDKMKAGAGEISNISMIEAMDNTAAQIASNFYFDELRKHLEVSEKRILVDKLPLNILQLSLINQVFPNAKYIIALRHPFDCVLSCWMQNFKLNPPMANMIELERIVDFYDVVMRILQLGEDRYSLVTHRIRYEDLVSNFEENVSNLLTFLGAKWEDDLKNFQKTALDRGIINTPSFSQVIKPLYKTASYRWKHYEKYLVQYKMRLTPWIKEYGYLG